MPSQRRPGATLDLEEVRPGLFIVHNPAIGPVLRGEGEREGDRFRLTSWRGEGLVARLRSRGFLVRTLNDQFDSLPELPDVGPPGAEQTRPLSGGERISYFAANPLGWQPVPLVGADESSAVLRDGWAVRRRRGRGPADYYRVVHGGLAPLGEKAALLIGYAQASRVGTPPVRATIVEGGYLLPDLALPPPHKALLGRLAEHTPAGWQIASQNLPLAEELLARLGLRLRAK